MGNGLIMVYLQEGVGGLVLEERLEEHPDGAEDADKNEDPQEETVNHHRYVFPVLADLQRGQRTKISAL